MHELVGSAGSLFILLRKNPDELESPGIYIRKLISLRHSGIVNSRINGDNIIWQVLPFPLCGSDKKTF